MSHPANPSCSRYITSMATYLLRWTSRQVITVTLFTHGPLTDQPLVQDTTCTYPTTLQTTAIPTPAVAGPTPPPLGTLHITLPVNFMQDPTISLPLMLKCSTRQQLSVFMQTCLARLEMKVIILKLLHEMLVYYSGGSSAHLQYNTRCLGLCFNNSLKLN